MSRAFVVNAIAGVVIAEALVLATRFERLVVPAAAAGVLFALGTLGAFFLSRYDTLLGFHETEVTTEAVVALVAEGVVLVALVPVLVSALSRRRHRAAARPSPDRTSTNPVPSDQGGPPILATMQDAEQTRPDRERVQAELVEAIEESGGAPSGVDGEHAESSRASRSPARPS